MSEGGTNFRATWAVGIVSWSWVCGLVELGGHMEEKQGGFCCAIFPSIGFLGGSTTQLPDESHTEAYS